MKYNVYSPEAVRKAMTGNKKVLVIANYNHVLFDEEANQEIAITTESLGAVFYPVIGGLTYGVKSHINYYYKGYEIFVEESLM